jgi:predicted metal-dependent hydrolase
MPLRASESWLQDVLEEKAHWVLEKLTDLQATVISEISWQNGDLLDYLGEQLVLRVLICPLKQPVQRRSSELWVFVNKIGDHAKIERAVKIWFHDEALKIFNERVLHFAFLLNVTPSIVKLSNAKTQWGSCTSRGVVRLNIQLINLPLHLIDYVVVHELAHLFEMNHSKAFWAKVESVCADYLCRRAELKAISL